MLLGAVAGLLFFRNRVVHADRRAHRLFIRGRGNMKRKLKLPGVLLLLLCASHIGTASAQEGGEERAAARAQLAENGEQPGDDWAMDPVAAKIVAGARAQIGNPYDASYVRIPYPNGDVPGKRGLCADVVVRALRAAGYDLQYLIHEDRKLNFPQYPRTWGWGRRGPDSNSDHRSNVNQMFYLGRFGLALPKEVSPDTLDQWQPGDIVYWNSGSPLGHVGIITDSVNEAGIPLVVHTGEKSVVEDDSLLTWPIVGHFRFPLKRKLPQDGTE